jgi:hypothetical protein
MSSNPPIKHGHHTGRVGSNFDEDEHTWYEKVEKSDDKEEPERPKLCCLKPIPPEYKRGRCTSGFDE